MADHLRHRPLTPQELDKRAEELSRSGPDPRTRLVTRVGGDTKPDPRVEIIRDGDGWTVELDLAHSVTEHRAGLSVGTIERGAAASVHQLDAHIPATGAISVHPETQPITAGPVKLVGRAGRNYTPLLVTPQDGRHILGSHSWPWNLTGRITTSDGAVGSGVLIGDRLVLTAHHMRPSNSIAAGHWWMTFTPNYDQGNAPFGSSNISDLRHFDNESDTEFVLGHDFMLCRLFEPLGQHLGFLGATTFDDGWRGMNVWNNVGYPIDVGGAQRPAVQTGQSMEDDYEDDSGQYIETEASLNHGNSGGPFFSWFTDGHVRLCSVVSGEASFDGDVDNVLAGGDDMINLISWGRANWPA